MKLKYPLFILFLLQVSVPTSSHASHRKHCLRLEGKHRKLFRHGQREQALIEQMKHMNRCRSAKFAASAARWAKNLKKLDLSVNLLTQAHKRCKISYMKRHYKELLKRTQKQYKKYVRKTLSPTKTKQQCHIGLRCKGGHVYIRKPLNVRVLFKYNSAVIQPEGQNLLDNTLAVLRTLLRNSHLRLKIIGHTDNKGSLRRNKSLSLLRAQRVLHYLCTRGKIKQHQMTAKGMAWFKPIQCTQTSITSCNRTDFQRMQNRRVEFKIWER